MKNLKRGMVVKMKSGTCEGSGNEQCISSVIEPLDDVGLFGHNQYYKTWDVEKILEKRKK